MAVLVPARENGKTPWARLIFHRGRSIENPIRLLNGVSFVEDEEVDFAHHHCRRLRELLADRIDHNRNRGQRLEDACPDLSFDANYSGDPEFKLGCKRHLSWEMGYLLSCLEEAGDFVPEPDVDYWATGMYDFDRELFVLDPDVFIEKVKYINDTAKKKTVLLAPVEPPELNTYPNITFRQIMTMDNLNRFLRPLERKDEENTNDTSLSRLDSFCNQSDGKGDKFVPRRILVHRQQETSLAMFTRALPGGTESDPKTLDEAVNAFERFIIFGGNGSGKTAALERCEYLLANQALAQPRAPYPVRLDLGVWNDDTSFRELRYRYLDRLKIPANRQPVFLADKLDSLDDLKLQQVIDDLYDSPNYGIILAGDLASVRYQLPLAGVELRSLNDEEIEKFVEISLGPDDSPSFLQQISHMGRRGDGISGLWEVLRSPRLLKLACNQADDVRGIDATQAYVTETEFLLLLANLLLTRINRHRRGERNQLPQLAEHLGPLALAQMKLGEMSVEVLDASQDISPNVLRLAMDCGFLDTNSEFDFASWRDLFAAVYLKERPHLLTELVTLPQAKKGALKPQRIKPVLDHLMRMVEDSSPVLVGIATRDPFLALDAIEHLPPGHMVSKESRHNLVSELATYLDKFDEDLYDLACEALVDFREDAVEPLQAIINDTRIDGWLRARMVLFLGRLECVEAFVALALALEIGGLPSKNARRVFKKLIHPVEPPLVDIAIREHLAKLGEDQARRIGEHLIKCWKGIEDGLIRTVGAVLQVDVMPYLMTTEGVVASSVVADTRPSHTYSVRPSERKRIEEYPEPLEIRPADSTNNAFGYSWTAEWAERPGDETLVRRGLSWLRSEAYSYGSWTYVWQPLFRHLPENQTLLDYGMKWLHHNDVTHRSWPFIWSDLNNKRPRDPELNQMGLDWLRQASVDHSSWSFVWKPLFETVSDPHINNDLKKMGHDWLGENSVFNRSFCFVWLALWEANAGRAEILKYAKYWLDQAEPGDMGWGFILPPLWLYFNVAHRYRNPETKTWCNFLKNRGIQFLYHGRRSSGEWSFVFQALWSSRPVDQELLNLGMEWLRTASPENGAFSFNWNLLHLAWRTNPEITEIGIRVLEKLPMSHMGWPSLWNGLMSRNCADNSVKCLAGGRRLGDLGPDLLDIQPHYHSAWSKTWSTVFTDRPNDQPTIDRGRKWLINVPNDDRGIGFVAEPLIRRIADDPEVREFLLKWLTDSDPGHPSWGHIWLAMVEVGNDLTATGNAWLNKKIWRHNEWSHVWVGVWNNMESQEARRDLCILGNEWLNQVHPRDRGRIRVLAPLVEFDPGAVQAHVAKYSMDFDVFVHALGKADLAQDKCPQDKLGWDMFWGLAKRDEETFTKFKRELTSWLQREDSFFSKPFPFIWKAMFEHEENRGPGFMDLARRWLRQTSMVQPGWALVWDDVVSVDGCTEEWRHLAWEWMDPRYWTRSSWPKVWLRLREAVPERQDELDELAQTLFEKEPPSTAKIKKHFGNFCEVWLKLASDRGPEYANAEWGRNAMQLTSDYNSLHERLRVAQGNKLQE